MSIYTRVKLSFGHEAVLGYLVGVGLDLDVVLYEEHVVDLVLAPYAIAGVVVVHAGHERE